MQTRSKRCAGVLEKSAIIPLTVAKTPLVMQFETLIRGKACVGHVHRLEGGSHAGTFQEEILRSRLVNMYIVLKNYNRFP